MTEVYFYDPSFAPDVKLIYSVIASRFQKNWLFVRHNERETWEIPGGHIEEGETSYEAAVRELMEETGSVDFRIECVATYCVIKNGSAGYGRLYLAEVFKIGQVPDTSEIAEVIMMNHLPQSLTYPDIQPVLFERITQYLKA
jgi:8-oxo-dGTP diphosphatase